MKIQPPKHALNFLRWFCREDFIEEIEGDLVELFEKRYTSASSTRAKWCFVWDVLRSFRPRYIRKFGANSFTPIMIGHYIEIDGRCLVRNKLPLTSARQAIKTAMINPVDSIRRE